MTKIVYLVLINLVTSKARAKHEPFVQQTGLCIHNLVLMHRQLDSSIVVYDLYTSSKVPTDPLHKWARISKFYQSCGLYYQPITIVNDDSSIINKLETSLIDNARVIIYDRHMFIVQATELTLFYPYRALTVEKKQNRYYSIGTSSATVFNSVTMDKL